MTKPHLLVLFFCAIVHFSVAAEPVTFVSVEDCAITAKYATTAENACAIFKSRRSANHRCPFVQSAAALLLPKRGNRTAQVLTLVRETGMSYKFAVIDIPTPPPVASGRFMLSLADELITRELRGVTEFWKYGNQVYSLVVDMLYDHLSSQIYVFTRKPERDGESREMWYDVFLLNADWARTQHLYGSRTAAWFYSAQRWSANPYRQMFYYQREQRFDGRIVTEFYAIPYPELLSSLHNGDRGSLVSRLDTVGATIQTVGDALRVITPNGSPFFLTLDKEESTVTECPNAYASANSSMFIVTGWEYCKLRDGAVASLDSCDALPPTGGIIGRWQVKWFHVLVITVVLFVTALALVLLCVRCRLIGANSVSHHYSFHMPSKAEDDEEFLDDTL